MGKMRLLLGALLFLSLGCQTNMKRAFEELKIGMDKDQVLEAIGGPRAVTRFHGKDRWFIVYYSEGFRHEKEIHFTNGLATYIGDTYEPPPEKSAAAVDKLNASQDVLTYQDLVRTRNTSEQAEANFEQKVRKEDKVRIVPQFDPIQ
jgi:outer membrane protein assembly factor BamE